MPAMIRTTKEFREIAEKILNIKNRMNDKKLRKKDKKKDK